MKILFFHPLTGRFWRGIERNVVGLSSTLSDRGHDVHILTLRQPQRALLDELSNRVTLHEVPSPRFFSYAAAVPWFATHLLSHSYDAVIIFFGGFGIGPSVRLASNVKHIPLFIYLGYPPSVAPHRYDEFERWRLSRTALQIWAHGDQVAQMAHRRFGREIASLPTGIDTQRFRPDPSARETERAKLGIGSQDPVILTVSALDERKGIQHVLEALPFARQRLPGLKYVIAGDGLFRDELVRQLGRLNLQGVVRFLPPQSDVAGLYQMADIFCLLSRGEAGPIAVYEALASQLAVVALDEPNLRQELGPELVELLPEPAANKVADALIALLNDDARRQRMGKEGRLAVERSFSLSNLGERVIELIEAAQPKTAIVYERRDTS